MPSHDKRPYRAKSRLPVADPFQKDQSFDSLAFCRKDYEKTETAKRLARMSAMDEEDEI
jgi:hypothetical protein